MGQAASQEHSTPGTPAPEGAHPAQSTTKFPFPPGGHFRRATPSVWVNFTQWQQPLCSLSGLTRDTHLQHLGVIEDLVLVAALADGKDALREVGALVQDQHGLSMFGLQGFNLLSVLRMDGHLRGQEEVSPGTAEEEKSSLATTAHRLSGLDRR